jgi:hypothetical protein
MMIYDLLTIRNGFSSLAGSRTVREKIHVERSGHMSHTKDTWSDIKDKRGKCAGFPRTRDPVALFPHDHDSKCWS